MDSYELLLVLHVIAVIVWLGTGFTMDILFLRAERTGDPVDMGKTGQMQEWLVPRVFIPSGLLTLLLGILLVLDSDVWAFDQLWILIGLAGWIASFGVGFLWIRPNAERMKEIVAQYGPMSPEVARRAKRLGVVSRVQLLALFLVVIDMVLKPTTDDVGTLVVLAGILVAAAAFGAWTLRRQPELASAPETH
jgi:uncharacterized membrane protein